jgi:VanZ family protein
MIRNNKWSAFSALLILYLSLASADSLNKIPVIHFPGMDKVVHFCMYAFLTGVLILENRKRISGVASVFIIVLIPFFLGAILEILQSMITSTRTGSMADLLANTGGIIFSVLVFLLFRKKKQDNMVR